MWPFNSKLGSYNLNPKSVPKKQNWFQSKTLGVSFNRNHNVCISKSINSKISIQVDKHEFTWVYKNDEKRNQYWDKLQEELKTFYLE